MSEEIIENLRAIARIIFANKQSRLDAVCEELGKIENGEITPELASALKYNSLFLSFIKQKFNGEPQKGEETLTFKYYVESFDMISDIRKNDPENLENVLEIVDSYVKEMITYQQAHEQLLKITSETSYFKLLNKSFCTRVSRSNVQPGGETQRILPREKKPINFEEVENEQNFDDNDKIIYRRKGGGKPDFTYNDDEGDAIPIFHQADYEKDEIRQKSDLAQLISYSDSDVRLAMDDFPMRTNYTYSDFADSLYRQSDFDLPKAAGCYSYRDLVDQPYDPWGSGQNIRDGFEANFRYISVMVGQVSGDDKLDKPCELIHDADHYLTMLEQSVINPPSDDHSMCLKHCVKKIYPNRTGLHVIAGIHQNEKVFERILKPRLEDALLKESIIFNKMISESYWLMFPVGPISFEPYKLLNKANNLLVEINLKYRKMDEWVNRAIFTNTDKAIKEGSAEATLEWHDVMLIEKFAEFYRVFAMKQRADLLPRGHSSLRFAAFPWEALYKCIINTAAKKIDKKAKPLVIRNVDKYILEMAEDMSKCKKRKDGMTPHMYKVSWQLSKKSLDVVVTK